MAIETFLTKRRSLYKGELGLFADNEMAEEDLRLFSLGEVFFKGYQPKTLEAQRFLWGLVYKTWQNTDYWIDHHRAMIALKKRVNFTKAVRNPETKQMEPAVRSITRIDGEQLRLLTERIKDVICADILPGMNRNDLTREVEEMLDVRRSG
jgi:hypothetical protein